MKRILITGFDAFGDNQANSSEQLLASLGSERVELTKLLLPTVYDEADKLLLDALKKAKPDALIMLGYSKAAKSVKLELVARNRDSKIAKDNQGKVGKDCIVGAAAGSLRSTWPVQETLQRLDQAKLSYHTSTNAGAFVCNHTYFLALNKFPEIPCIFVHVNRQDNAISEAQKVVNILLEI